MHSASLESHSTQNERGVTKVEYALILSCFLIVGLPGVRLAGTYSSQIFLRAGQGVQGLSSGLNPINGGSPGDGGDAAESDWGGTEGNPGAPTPNYGGGTETTTPGEQYGFPDDAQNPDDDPETGGQQHNRPSPSDGTSGVGNDGINPLQNDLGPLGRVRLGRVVQRGY